MIATTREAPPRTPREARAPAAGRPPIVAALEPKTAAATSDVATRLARELDAPVAFVFVRRRARLGEAFRRGRRRELLRGLYSLQTGLAAATRDGVMACGEILEGDPSTRIVELAKRRRAKLLVVGPPRRRLLRSVARRVIATAEVPVVVAARRRDAARVVIPFVAQEEHAGEREHRHLRDERDRDDGVRIHGKTAA